MSDRLLQRAVELAWRHWTALGVAGVAPLPDCAVDVEALIAFTPFIAAADPRLERECVDWCTRIAPDNVSVSRLRQLVAIMPPTPDNGTVDLAAFLLNSRKPRPVALSKKSRPPRVEHPSLLQLRSRRIFGMGARADVIAALCMRDPRAEPTRISTIGVAGYTKFPLAAVVDELADAGVLEKLIATNTATYKLIKRRPLRALLAPLPRRAPSWPERFALVAQILETHRRVGKRATYVVELAKVLDQLRPLAASIGEIPPTTGRPATLLATIDRWSLRLLEP